VHLESARDGTTHIILEPLDFYRPTGRLGPETSNQPKTLPWGICVFMPLGATGAGISKSQRPARPIGHRVQDTRTTRGGKIAQQSHAKDGTDDVDNGIQSVVLIEFTARVMMIYCKFMSAVNMKNTA
jgi:hypothetical protein